METEETQNKKTTDFYEPVLTSYDYPEFKSLQMESLRDTLEPQHSKFRAFQNEMLGKQLMYTINVHSPLCTMETLLNYLPLVECRYKSHFINEYYYHKDKDTIIYLFRMRWNFTYGKDKCTALMCLE